MKYLEFSELRIGNTIGFYKPDITELQRGIIKQILLNEHEEYTFDVPEFSNMVNIESIKGICGFPLIEKILLEFGWVEFQDSAPGNFYYKGWFMIKVINGEFFFYKRLSDKMYTTSALLKKIEFIHELENLYFELTHNHE